MTKEQVAQQRKRLEGVWNDLQQADETLVDGAQTVRRRIRDAFRALLKVDQFLGELEAEAERGAS